MAAAVLIVSSAQEPALVRTGMTGRAEYLTIGPEYNLVLGLMCLDRAEKGGFSLVVDKGSDSTLKIVIYHRDGIDLTEQVIKEFDRQNK